MAGRQRLPAARTEATSRPSCSEICSTERGPFMDPSTRCSLRRVISARNDKKRNHSGDVPSQLETHAVPVEIQRDREVSVWLEATEIGGLTEPD